MKKKIFITLLTAGSLLSSCQKQILDVDQLDVINLEQYYSNLTDPKAESLIASVYKTAYGVTNNNCYNMMHGYTDEAPFIPHSIISTMSVTSSLKICQKIVR